MIWTVYTPCLGVAFLVRTLSMTQLCQQFIYVFRYRGYCEKFQALTLKELQNINRRTTKVCRTTSPKTTMTGWFRNPKSVRRIVPFSHLCHIYRHCPRPIMAIEKSPTIEFVISINSDAIYHNSLRLGSSVCSEVCS